MPNNSIKITDTTLRDGQQSLLATRLRTEDIIEIATHMSNIPFYSMEVWGGATFDSATRFLAEDPWVRLKLLKETLPNTPLMMLLRGKSLVGYQSYENEIIDSFIKESAKTGIDIFRVFDALNDEENLKQAAKAVKAENKHLQMTICYSATENTGLDGPIYNLEYYENKAKKFQEMGADSICIKDMAGIISPYDIFKLVSSLKKIIDVPIQFHTHSTSGLGPLSVIKAIEANVDIVDTCLSPLSLRTSQPPIEPLLITLKNSERDPNLNLDQFIIASEKIKSILPKYSDLILNSNETLLDSTVLKHQIPGGMYTNLLSQLRESDSLGKLEEVLKEIPNTRKDMGNPPLVTPISQIVGSQAVSNVIFGKYKIISEQMQNYIHGDYGNPPSPINPEIIKMIPPKQENNSSEKELDNAKNAVNEISQNIQDVLTYALFPNTGMKFLRMKYGLDPIPESMNLYKSVPTQKLKSNTTIVKNNTQNISPNSKTYNVHIGNESFQVTVDPTIEEKTLSNAITNDVIETTSLNKQINDINQENIIKSPLPGILSKYLVKEGQNVKQGDKIVVIEAMKMENTIPAHRDGTIKSLPLEPGVLISREEILAILEDNA